jgi:hypothetical protein
LYPSDEPLYAGENNFAGGSRDSDRRCTFESDPEPDAIEIATRRLKFS